MRALVWTRSPTARDIVALALSRSGNEVEIVGERAHLAARLAMRDEDATLVLGPSFTMEEAREIGRELEDDVRLVAVVLLEDLSRPLPCRRVVQDVPTRVLTLPLRMRPLLEAVRAPALSAPGP